MGRRKYIILAIIFIVLTALIFTSPYFLWQEIRNLIVPWATLALAFVTIFTIIQSNIRDEKQRNENRKLEIMKWIEDIVNETSVIKLDESEREARERGGYNVFMRSVFSVKLNHFNSLNMRSKHIQISASLFNDEKIHDGVKELKKAISELINDNWKNLNRNDIQERLFEHEQKIYNVAKPLYDHITVNVDSI